MNQKKYGHFDDARREYVITDPQTPWPWINYLGNEDFFSLISNTAGGYSFYKDAKFRRITRYRYNNVPMDNGGRYFYIVENGEMRVENGELRAIVKLLKQKKQIIPLRSPFSVLSSQKPLSSSGLPVGSHARRRSTSMSAVMAWATRASPAERTMWSARYCSLFR